MTGESPIVDTQSTSVGNTLDTAKLQRRADRRPTCGARWRSRRASGCGASTSAAATRASSPATRRSASATRRASSPRAWTRPRAPAAPGFYQDYFAQRGIAVSAAGRDVTMNTPGAAVISTIKSGGNTFPALINQTYEGKSFVGDNIDADDRGARLHRPAEPAVLGEATTTSAARSSATRLWFFAAYNHFKIDKVISGVDPEHRHRPRALQQLHDEGDLEAVGRGHASSATTSGRARSKPLRGLSATTGRRSRRWRRTAPSWMYNGQWQRVWSNRLFTRGQRRRVRLQLPEQPAVDYKTQPAAAPTSGTGVDRRRLATSYERRSRSAATSRRSTGNATYFLPDEGGSHDLKFGCEWLNDKSNFASNGTSGPILYLDSNGAVDQIRLTDLGDPAKLRRRTGRSRATATSATRSTGRTAGALNSRVTVTVGVRYDRQQPYYVDGEPRSAADRHLPAERPSRPDDSLDTRQQCRAAHRRQLLADRRRPDGASRRSTAATTSTSPTGFSA